MKKQKKKIYDTITQRITNGEEAPIFEVNIQIPREMENKILVNEQLLGHFYLKVAGDAADESVLTQLLADYYDNSFFTSEEEAFLTLHYVEVINYIVETSYLIFQEYGDGKENHLLPPEVLEFVATEFVVPDDATIYNPFAGFAQFANIYEKAKFVCEESYTIGRDRNCRGDANWLWAWMKVALFANNRNTIVIDNNEVPTSYDYAISYIPYTTTDFFTNPSEDESVK